MSAARKLRRLSIAMSSGKACDNSGKCPGVERARRDSRSWLLLCGMLAYTTRAPSSRSIF